MPPTASVLFPTRRRRGYLAVALASVAPQVARHGAELIVVEDDAADPETERLVTGHGGRYVAHGEPRGINVARNTALAEAAGELLCFLDDDVEAWPAWLDALLRAAAECPGHEAFGGPIRPRLEGGNLHACGREPLPVTSLDLGPGTPTPSSRGGRTSRCAAERWSGSAASTRRWAARATRRTGSAACAPRAGGSATWRRRASTTGAPAPTPASAASPARPSTAGALRAATTRSRAALRGWRASCARWRAACGMSSGGAAGTGSC